MTTQQEQDAVMKRLTRSEFDVVNDLITANTHKYWGSPDKCIDSQRLILKEHGWTLIEWIQAGIAGL